MPELVYPKIMIFFRETCQVSPEDPKMHNNPVLQKPLYKETGVPVVIHGDKVPYTKNESMLVVSFSFLLGFGLPMLDQCFMICCFPASATCHKKTHGLDTWQTIWAWLAWSFACLFDGRHPVLDPFRNAVDANLSSFVGSLTTAGFFGVVWILTYDMEFGSNDLGCKHFNSLDPCEFCACNRSTRPLTDVRPNASWKQTLVSKDAAKPSDHPVWTIPGFFCLLRATPIPPP